jgi:hypothetical protein
LTRPIVSLTKSFVNIGSPIADILYISIKIVCIVLYCIQEKGFKSLSIV